MIRVPRIPIRCAMVSGALALGSASAAQTAPGPTQHELDRAMSSTADWLLPGHDYGAQRYVELSQITPETAPLLRPVCTYRTGTPLAFHTNPLVHRGVMYLTTRYETIAIDARTCQQRWLRDHDPQRQTRVQANRGVALKDGRVVRGTADGRLVAMDAATGEVIWERVHADGPGGEKFNMAPLAFEDLVIIGVAGSETGIQGWIGAFRIADGDPAWRFNVVPKPGEPGAETWGEAALEEGGAGVWTPVTLDLEQGLVFVGTADPAPVFDGTARPGANLFSNSLVVLDARTGRLAWYRQLVHHDELDRGVTSPGPLYTVDVDGRPRTRVATAGKDGMLRVFDRGTRELVFETPVTTMLNPVARPTPEGVRVCPGILGGVEWNGPAFSPSTGLLYVPAVDWCTTFRGGGDPSGWRGRLWAGNFTLDPVESSRGWLTAVDARTGAVRWRYASAAPMVGAITATSADVLFTGEVSGDFLALDARDGKVLFRHPTGGAVAGGVISYALDGKQYVAAMSGGMTAFWLRGDANATVVVFALP